MHIIVNDAAVRAEKNTVLKTAGSYYTNILLSLGYQINCPPLGDLFRLFYRIEEECLIVSPIHWEVTHNDAMIVAVERGLQLASTEIKTLFSLVEEFFQDSGMKIIYHDEYTWLLCTKGNPSIKSQSIYSLLHQSLMPILKKLDKGLFWQRVITEAQMYLSLHTFNKQRGSKPPINGLWFWGEGKLDLRLEKNIFTDDELLLSLANKRIYPISELASTVKSRDILAIKYPQRIDVNALKKKLPHTEIRWYWNNLSYVQPATTWWSKLWSYCGN